MRKFTLFKTMLTMLLLFVGMGAWAEEATLSISSGFTSNGNLNDNQSNSWAITSDGSYTSSNSYIQVGSNKSNVTYLKLSTSAYSSMTITKIQVWGTSKASTDVTAKVSIGGHQLGESSAYTTQNASSGGTEFSVNNTNGYKGEVLIEISRPSSATGAIYFNKLIVTYEDAADTRTAVNMTAFSATETTIVKGNTSNTTVTNDQNGWTPSYTYTSSNTEVATINESGVITAVAKGTATITAALNIANDDASYKKGTTTSMDVNITVVNPEHTAHFSVNGSVNEDDDCVAREEDAITFPSNPADIDGKKFQGWTKIADYSNATTAPSDLCVSANMENSDVTYYAVFADIEVGEDIPTTFYYEPFTGSAHSTGFASDNVAATQSMFYDKNSTVWSHYTDTKAPSTTSYATNLDGSSMSNGIKIYKQLNNSTATILEVKGIDIRNAKNLNVSLYDRRSTSAATLTVEYKIDNAANYTATGGSIIYSSSNDTWKFSDGLTISGTGSTLDLKISVKVTGTTNRTMLIDDVKVYGDLSGTTYSNYCTTVAAPATSVDVTISEVGYSTFFDAVHAVELPAGVNGYVFTAASGLEAAYGTKESDRIVPAGEPLVLGGTAGTYTLNYTTSPEETYKDNEMNDLCGAATDMTASDMVTANPGMSKFYALSLNSAGQNVGFYWIKADGAAFGITAGKAYLALPAATPINAFTFGDDDEETAISSVSEKASQSGEIFNLAGQRVAKAVKGLYIMSGKKVLVK